jgi:hypothetical protein
MPPSAPRPGLVRAVRQNTPHTPPHHPPSRSPRPSLRHAAPRRPPLVLLQGKQKEAVMQAEISKRGAEIASLRGQLEASELRNEGLRGEVAQGVELLARKRDKKKQWKVRGGGEWP